MNAMQTGGMKTLAIASAGSAENFPRSTSEFAAKPAREHFSGAVDLAGQRYRALILSIALFVVLDLGVLALNYVSSGLFARDAARINTASELRMLTQQIAKSVLTLRDEQRDGLPTQTSLAQISEASLQFDKNLQSLAALSRSPAWWERGFDASGVARQAEGAEVLADISKLWDPMRELLQPLLKPEVVLSRELIESAANRVVARNIKMADKSGELSALLELGALEQAARLRTIQIAALILALLNFAYIIFKFIRQLRAGDAVAAAARAETEEILRTVRSGLILISADGRIASQVSQHARQVLGSQVAEGKNLFSILSSQLDDESRAELTEYLALLFSGRVKPLLVQQLNPLREVTLRTPDGAVCTLDFEFSPVFSSTGQIAHVLVTFEDISERAALAREVGEVRERSRSEMELVMGLMAIEPGVLRAAVLRARRSVTQINQCLARFDGGALESRSLLQEAMALTHRAKGEAYLVGLEALGLAIHQLEEQFGDLAKSRQGELVGGAAMIPASIALQDISALVDRMETLMKKLASFGAGWSNGAAAEALGSTGSNPVITGSAAVASGNLALQLEQLAQTIAADESKLVRVQFRNEIAWTDLEPYQEMMQATLPQLLRNAVVHGIESPEERLRMGKSAEGVVSIQIRRDAAGPILTVRDDGRGLSAEAIRTTLVRSKLLDETQAAALSDHDAVMKIFEPGFSTTEQVSVHAGRGVGLSVVQEVLKALGAKLRVSARPNRFTQFEILLGVPPTTASFSA